MCSMTLRGTRFPASHTDKWNLFLANKACQAFARGAMRKYVKQFAANLGRRHQLGQKACSDNCLTPRRPDCPGSDDLVPRKNGLPANAQKSRPDGLGRFIGARPKWTSNQVRSSRPPTKLALRALQWSLGARADYILFLEMTGIQRHSVLIWRDGAVRNRAVALPGCITQSSRVSL